MPRRTSGARSSEHDRQTHFVEREVRSEDPSLSEETNERVTRELRDAVGKDRVEVPAETPRYERESHGGHRPLTASGASTRGLVAITFAAAVTVGVAISLATGSWWAVVAASAVHALGTTAVLAVTMNLASKTEHVSPTTAARLEDEGVADPDRMFSDMVSEYTEPGKASHPRRRLANGQEDPAQSWRSYVVLGSAVVAGAAVSMIVVGLLLGWYW